MIPVSYSLRNLRVRRATTAAAAFGLALVVFVFASALMLSNGIEKTLGRSASADIVVVLRKGATSELESVIEDNSVGLVFNERAAWRSSEGARGTGELVVLALLDKIGTQGVSNAQLRGVSPYSLALRPTVHVIAGRLPNPGADEMMVGKAIRGRLKGLDLGGSFELRKNRSVKVVGVFEDGGSSNESEVWGDLDTVRSAFKREGLVSSIRARVLPARFDTFKASVESNRQSTLQVLREVDYYEKQSEATSIFIRALGIVIALFFSFGAVLGGMITMHAAVASRRREIGTLRALGFGRGSILASFVLESLFLSLLGGLLGVGAALSMSLVTFSMLNFATWSEIVFKFEPKLAILLQALLVAAAVGVLGGLFPAIRASRVNPADAMR